MLFWEFIHRLRQTAKGICGSEKIKTLALEWRVSLKTSQSWCFSLRVIFPFHIAISYYLQCYKFRVCYPPSLPVYFALLLSQRKIAARAPSLSLACHTTRAPVVRAPCHQGRLVRQTQAIMGSLLCGPKWAFSPSQLRISQKYSKAPNAWFPSFLKMHFFTSQQWRLLPPPYNFLLITRSQERRIKVTFTWI